METFLKTFVYMLTFITILIVGFGIIIGLACLMYKVLGIISAILISIVGIALLLSILIHLI